MSETNDGELKRRRFRRRRRDRGRSVEAGTATTDRLPRLSGEVRRAIRSLARDAAAIVLLLAAIVYAVHHVRPIFANRPSLAESLAGRASIARSIFDPSPSDTGALLAMLQSPQFAADREAFAADLVRTGRMSPARADSISFYAVREAYQRGIPPAVIFGVMLTENALFLSGAMSNVGAVGLMQVYPKVWLKELGHRFGTDLASDSTNVKYGVYILSEYIKPQRGSTTVSERDVNKGLLRYNGCVRGTNTPHCRTYPAKVRRYVEREAESLCGTKTFYECIAKPFVDGLLGTTE